MKSICLAVSCLIITSVAAADTINVPVGGDIQAAINGASDGDIIQLEAGEYFPAATIDTLGKAVTLRGVPGKRKDDAPMSVIDGQDSMRVLQCTSGEGADTVFENLLITGGLAEGQFPDCCGGGMFNHVNSSPTLTDCTFEGNSARDGGGMASFFSSPTLENCTFEGNSADNDGGGMLNASNSSPTLTDCSFTGNSAYRGGGILNNQKSNPTLSDCTFAGNSADYGGGMSNYNYSSAFLTNCTFCGNTPDQIDGDWTDHGGNTIAEECPEEGCPGDFDSSGIVDVYDLLNVIASWGNPDSSGIVDVNDLLLVLEDWGGVPPDCSSSTSSEGVYLGISSELITNTIPGYETYRLYVNLAPGARLDAVFGNTDSPMSIESIAPFYQNTYGGPTSQDINSGLFPVIPELEWDSYVTIGCLHQDGYPFNSNELFYMGIDWIDFNEGGGVSTNNGGWIITPDSEQGMEINGRVLIGQFTVPKGADIAVVVNLQGRDANGASWQVLGAHWQLTDEPDPECPADFNGDGQVDGGDVGLLIAAWGTSGKLYDLNLNGQVDGGDVGLLIAAWGPCAP